MSKSNVMLHPILALDVGNGYGKASILTDWTQEPMALLPESLRQGMDTTAYVAPDGTIEVYPARPRAARAVRAVKSRLEESVIYLEEKGKLSLSPNGNGGWFKSLVKSGLDREMKAMGDES